MHKEGNQLCIIYSIKYGCYHRLESVLYVRDYYFYIPHNQTTSCQYKLSKILVQRIIEAQSILPCYNRNKTNRTRVLSQNKIYVLVRVRVIKSLGLAASLFDTYAPEFVLMIYSAIKHGYGLFYFLIVAHHHPTGRLFHTTSAFRTFRHRFQ